MVHRKPMCPTKHCQVYDLIHLSWPASHKDINAMQMLRHWYISLKINNWSQKMKRTNNSVPASSRDLPSSLVTNYFNVLNSTISKKIMPFNLRNSFIPATCVNLIIYLNYLTVRFNLILDTRTSTCRSCCHTNLLHN